MEAEDEALVAIIEHEAIVVAEETDTAGHSPMLSSIPCDAGLKANSPTQFLEVGNEDVTCQIQEEVELLNSGKIATDIRGNTQFKCSSSQF